MTNKLVVIINSLKVPKIKKILLYEMKFLVPNYSCLQNPWLGGYRPQIPVVSVLNWTCWTPPPNKIPGYATEKISWGRCTVKQPSSFVMPNCMPYPWVASIFFKFLKIIFLLSPFEKLHHLLFHLSILFLTFLSSCMFQMTHYIQKFSSYLTSTFLQPCT